MKTLMQSMNKREQKALLAIKTRQTNTIEQTLQRQYEERSKLENKLRNQVIQYFTKLEKQVLTTYKKASSQGIPAHNIQVLIMMLIQSWHEEYTPLLNHYHQLIQKLATKQNNELILLQQKRTLGLQKSNETLTIKPILTLNDNPLNLLAVKVQTTLDGLLENEEPQHYRIEENKQITEQIKQSNFKFSEKTRQRVTREINEILTHSETEGIGPYQVSEQIRDKFAELKTYEANRIARTEINRADNTYRYDDIMNNDLIDYIKWHGHDDGKERDSHIKCNGEIIRKGELFSNGLRFPGDPHGPAKEVINCRCTIVPWIPPFDKMPPTGMDHFKESDLLAKPADAGQQFLLETIENTRIITPTTGGMNVAPENLQISKVKKALNETTKAALAGEIKNKQQLQTTLNKLLEISKKPTKKPVNKIKPILSDKEVNNLSLKELADYYEVEYKGALTYPYDGRKYHTFVEHFDGSELTLRFEDTAIKSYTKQGIATPQEIIQEVFQTSKKYKRETNEIWFKNTNTGISHRPTKTGYDTLKKEEGGYNTYTNPELRGREIAGKLFDDPNHRIVISAKQFKTNQFANKEDQISFWKHSIHHEFAHSKDLSRKNWLEQGENGRLSLTDEYKKIHEKEKYFTPYANTAPHESFAEHGGYIDYMLTHPEEQSKKILIRTKNEHGRYVNEFINFQQYRERFPEHYTYFKNIIEREETLIKTAESIVKNTKPIWKDRTYDKLMNKFLSHGGQLKLKKGKPVLEGGNLSKTEKQKLLNFHQQKLQQLQNETSNAIIDNIKLDENTYKLTSQRQKLNERIIKHKNKVTKLKQEKEYYSNLHEVTLNEQKMLPHREWIQDKKIKELEDKIQILKTGTSVDINKIKPELREEYKQLLHIKETRSLTPQESSKLNVILKRSGEFHESNPKLLNKLTDELEKLKNQKQTLIDKEHNRLERLIKRYTHKVEHHTRMIRHYEKRIGRAHIKLKTKPSEVIRDPPRTEYAEGTPFTRWDHIEGYDREVVTEEYDQLGQVYNAQESNKTIGTTHYTKGSGHFNQYVRQKLDNDIEGMEDTLINALVNTSSKQNEYYKKVKDFITLPTLDDNGKANPTELKEAIKSFKKLLAKKDKRAIAALEDMKETFERDYREFMHTAVELTENVVTVSGQNIDKIGELTVGEKYVAPTFISTALSEDATDYFIGRLLKDGKKACKIKFFNREQAKYVVVGPRSEGNILETELIQLPGTEGDVFHTESELFDSMIDEVHTREEIPVYYVMI